jgi:outer membrane protein assembly factor BamC
VLLGSVVVLGAAVLLTGCTVVREPSRNAEYKTGAARTRSLDVPPDLTQLSRDSRFAPQGGVVTASAAGRPSAPGAAAAAAPGAQTVALQQRGEVRIAREGAQRWIVTPQSPEQLWPLLRTFWESNGFTLASENAAAGTMETNWSENRAKLPTEVTRLRLDSLLGRLLDTGERDQYRTRIERGPAGTEIYISHRGIEEVDTSTERDQTRWRPRASDPQLEAEFLGRLLVALGQPAPVAAAAVAAAEPAAAASTGAVRARALEGAAGLELDEPFDRAWRRVGQALDRGGFSVEDRDRNGGLYYVRYIDPALAGREEPNFLMRLFTRNTPTGPLRYRVALKPAGNKTTLTVQTSAGAPETGPDGQRIVAQLLQELR